MQPDPQSQQQEKPPAKPPMAETLASEELPTTGDFVPPADDSGTIPAKIGIYKIEKLLGQGGMGAVYLAEDPTLERKVALKVMRSKAAANPTAHERFLREARAAAKVESDHIIRVHQVGEDKGMPFIAMEYLKGKPMDAWMRESKPTVKQIIRIGFEAAMGLHAAHKAGLIHRDIKPANLWLEAPSGRVKILDFGLARPAADDVQLTNTGVVVGTPAYMSPEQGRGKDVDHRTDIFSLGCVLYHLATGRRPFSGSTSYEIIANLIAETPEPPAKLNPQIPQALSDAIMQMLEKDAAKRPAKARSVAEAMAKIQKELERPLEIMLPDLPVAVPMPVTGGETTAWDHLDESGQQKPATSVKVETLPPKKSSRKLMIGSAIGAAILLGVCGWVISAYWTPANETGGGRRDMSIPKQPTVTPITAAPPDVAGKESVNGPLDLAWVKKAGKMTPEQQFEFVRAEIWKRNPGFINDGVFEYHNNNNKDLHCYSANLKDIAPLSVMKHLKKLTLAKYNGDDPDRDFHCPLSDLSPLRGIELDSISFHGSLVRDITPLASMSNHIYRFDAERSWISDLSTLKGKNFVTFAISGTAVTSIAPLKTSLIEEFVADGTKIEDIHLLNTTNLKRLHLKMLSCDLSFLRNAQFLNVADVRQDIMKRHVSLLKSITLNRPFNNRPAGEFWKDWDEKNGFKPMEAGWVDTLSKLPEAEQLTKIRAEIIKRNGSEAFEKEGGQFIADPDQKTLRIIYKKLKDITPLEALTCRAFVSFTEACETGRGKPGMDRCDLENISALANNKTITGVDISGTNVVDLTPLLNKKLTKFLARDTDLRDISVLAGQELVEIDVRNSKVDAIKDLPAFRKTLTTINGQPAAEYWKSLEGKK